ncbi:MAG: AarF/ABC1/UbiB kinase family protein [Candidatus Binatia bacterium]
MHLGVLASNVAAGAAMEGARRWWAGERPALADLVLQGANPRQLASGLARMRGAAMKLGQLLSLEGGAVLPPALADALATLRSDGDRMTTTQLQRTLTREYGRGWRHRFRTFDEEPIAAASIGQVHRAVAADGRELVLKIQFPGVAKSIDSDVDNLAALLRLTRILPPDLEVEALLTEIKRQLRRETDYRREAWSLQRYRHLMAGEPGISVPRPHPDLTTRRILAMDHARGVPVSTLWRDPQPQAVRDAVGRTVQRLVLRELFEFGFMQSDPNFGNYLWSEAEHRLTLLDLGSTIEVSVALRSRYHRLLEGVLLGNRASIRRCATEMAWLAPDERDDRAEGLVDLILLACEPIYASGPYDYGSTDLASRARDAALALAFERGLVRPPPPEMLFIHRKLAGTYLLSAQLGARVDTAALVQSITAPEPLGPSR